MSNKPNIRLVGDYWRCIRPKGLSPHGLGKTPQEAYKFYINMSQRNAEMEDLTIKNKIRDKILRDFAGVQAPTFKGMNKASLLADEYLSKQSWIARTLAPELIRGAFLDGYYSRLYANDKVTINRPKQYRDETGDI